MVHVVASMSRGISFTGCCCSVESQWNEVGSFTPQGHLLHYEGHSPTFNLAPRPGCCTPSPNGTTVGHGKGSGGAAAFAGMNGASTMREVDLETGQTLRHRALAHADFAEGVTRLGGRCGGVPYDHSCRVIAAIK